MRLTKLGHACVRLEKDGSVLVIDPGTFERRRPGAGRRLRGPHHPRARRSSRR